MSFTDCNICKISFREHTALDLHMKKVHNEFERDKYERKIKIAQKKEEEQKVKEQEIKIVQKKEEENVKDGEEKGVQEDNKHETEETQSIHKFNCSWCKSEFLTDNKMEEHMELAHHGLPEDDKDAPIRTSELSAIFDAVFQMNPELFEESKKEDPNKQTTDLEESEDDDEIESAKTTTYPNKDKGPKFPEWEEVEEGEPQHQGMLIKGKSNGWISATLKVKLEFENNKNVEYKDDKGRTLTVTESTPKSRSPIEVEVVTKSGERGNARIVFHGPSKKKGVTVQVLRKSGHEFKFVTCVAKKFIGIFLNLILRKGEQGLKEIIKMRQGHENKYTVSV